MGLFFVLLRCLIYSFSVSDALLADLQNTVSPETTTPGYGSLNGKRSHSSAASVPSYKACDNRQNSPLLSQSVKKNFFNLPFLIMMHALKKDK